MKSKENFLDYMSSFLPSHHPISLLFTEKKTLLPHHPVSWNLSSLLSPSLHYNCSYRGHQGLPGESVLCAASLLIWSAFSEASDRHSPCRDAALIGLTVPQSRVLRPLPSPLQTYTSWTTQKLATPRFTSPAPPSLQHSSCIFNTYSTVSLKMSNRLSQS